MSIRYIESYCRKFLNENYNVDLKIPVELNNRFTATLGCFNTNKKNEAISLEFSKKYYNHASKEDFIKLMKHECIHYALFTLGLPCEDGHPVFEKEIKKHDSNPTGTVDFRTMRNVRVYKCNCREFVFKQTISASRCSKCDANLKYVELRKQLI